MDRPARERGRRRRTGGGRDLSLLLEVVERDTWTVVVLSGRLDTQCATELPDALRAVIEARPARLALDLAGVQFISSAALRVLLETKKAVASWRGELRLVAPRRAVLEVLALAGFDRLFEVRDDLG